jgi:hypothetical protein
MDEQQWNDQLLASAVKFLIDGGEEKAAAVLLSCTLAYEEHRWVNEEDIPYVEQALEQGKEVAWNITPIITLTAPRAAYDILGPINHRHYYEADFRVEFGWDAQENFAISDAIIKAFRALLGGGTKFVIRAMLITINDQWRHELLTLLRGEHVSNQGLQFSPQTPVVTWNGLHFRSGAEVRIAEALERVERPPVLFLPNCMARLGFSHRENREADFLICQKGKWGILEVDGPLSHPPARKVDDDERARLFKAHGIRLVEHFDAGDCLEDADGVVKRFLYLLGQ